MKDMKKILLVGMVAGLLMTSCTKDEIGGTVLQQMAGEWFCELQFQDDGEWVNLLSLYGADYFFMLTYNTAANNNELFIDDEEELWPFKGKVKCDIDNLTFSTGGTQTENLYDKDASFEVKNGKILLGGARSVAGHVTDGIYMEIEFADDPGEIYRIIGHRRTGFDADYHFDLW